MNAQAPTDPHAELLRARADYQAAISASAQAELAIAVAKTGIRESQLAIVTAAAARFKILSVYGNHGSDDKLVDVAPIGELGDDVREVTIRLDRPDGVTLTGTWNGIARNAAMSTFPTVDELEQMLRVLYPDLTVT